MKENLNTTASENRSLKVRHRLSEFQDELATAIEDMACKDFQDINNLDDDLIKQFKHIVTNYSRNLTHAMCRLAIKARMAEAERF